MLPSRSHGVEYPHHMIASRIQDPCVWSTNHRGMHSHCLDFVLLHRCAGEKRTVTKTTKSRQIWKWVWQFHFEHDHGLCDSTSCDFRNGFCSFSSVTTSYEPNCKGLHCMVQHKHEAIFDNFEFLQSREKGTEWMEHWMVWNRPWMLNVHVCKEGRYR